MADPRQLLSDWLEPKNPRGDHGEWGRCIKLSRIAKLSVSKEAFPVYDVNLRNDLRQEGHVCTVTLGLQAASQTFLCRQSYTTYSYDTRTYEVLEMMLII